MSPSESELLPEPLPATPEWLSAVLRDAGVLPEGHVRQVRVVAEGRQAGTVFARLEVGYAPDAPATAPRKLFLKTPRPDRPVALTSRLGQREVTFYTRLAAGVPELPSIRCFAAAHAPASGAWHLLLEDVADTHTQTPWPVPPSQGVCEQAVDALAALHAHWWDHPRLEQDLGAPITAADVRRGIAEADRLVRGLLEFLGDRLSPDRRRVYERALAALPALWAWFGRRTAKTLCHGDAHLWNFLFPRHEGARPVYLCDWQTWAPGVPTLDLVTMIVLDWYPERRARLERGLVRRYHARLQAPGVRDYDWDACWHDYRMAAVNALFTPPWRWDNGTAAPYWWPHLETAMAAFEDLGAAALLDA